jgi:cell fate regulator YaaT (PSP1 superfamily)
MPILPLPQFEADLEADAKVYAALKPPKSIVVRFGVMKMVGEFPYSGDAKPGCGSKLVVRTGRGTEIGEMLTSTCPNSGCSKSVSRKEMLQYIENSGGRDYPFHSDGRILRIATMEDMQEQTRIEQVANDMRLEARRHVEELKLPVKIVQAEPLLGGERVTFYFTSEERVDFRDLVRILGQQYSTRIEMRQVGARDEARLTADYERCGQYCCCKNFLKVLKPISMRSAKIQKATLDPLKISGRCGRLMCCLRYEDESYEELRKRLPRRKQRVGTPEGDGWVIDTQILTQLALIQLENEDRQVAIAVEDLTEPGPVGAPPATPPAAQRPAAPGAAQPAEDGNGQPPRRTTGDEPRARRGGGRNPSGRPRPEPQPGTAPPARAPAPAPEPASHEQDDDPGDLDSSDPGTPETDTGATTEADGQPRRRRRRRRRRGGGRQPGGEGGNESGRDGTPPPAPPGD